MFSQHIQQMIRLLAIVIQATCILSQIQNTNPTLTPTPSRPDMIISTPENPTMVLRPGRQDSPEMPSQLPHVILPPSQQVRDRRPTMINHPTRQATKFTSRTSFFPSLANIRRDEIDEMIP